MSHLRPADMRLLSVGFDNYIAADRVTAVLGCQSAPLRRMIQEYRANSRLVDATQGRRMRALLLLDSGYLVASALTPETLARRLSRNGPDEQTTEEAAERELKRG
jgi:extracellular matrix regulatory protein A